MLPGDILLLCFVAFLTLFPALRRQKTQIDPPPPSALAVSLPVAPGLTRSVFSGGMGRPLPSIADHLSPDLEALQEPREREKKSGALWRDFLKALAVCNKGGVILQCRLRS